MRALSLFAGAGGLDLGAAAAGYDVVLSTDLSACALEVLGRTTGTQTIAGELGRLMADRALSAAWSGGAPDIVIGGPPCTAFSHAGFWLDYKRKGADPAALGVSLYLDVVERFRPRAFVMENVPGLRFKTHREAFVGLLDRAAALGYATEWQVLVASDFGVPQARKRLFVVGVRRGVGGSSVRLSAIPRLPGRTVSWAIGDGCGEPEKDEVPRGKYFDLLKAVPPGGNYMVHTAERGAREPRFGYRSRYWSFLSKLDPEGTSPTIPAQRVTWNGPFHWDNRHLRVREMARLQGFPDDVRFSVDLPSARRQIGNAVPVLLAAVVLDRVATALTGTPATPEALAVARRPDATWAAVSAALTPTGRVAVDELPPTERGRRPAVPA